MPKEKSITIRLDEEENNKTILMNFRVSETERDLLKKNAKLLDVKVSQFIRQAIYEKISKLKNNNKNTNFDNSELLDLLEQVLSNQKNIQKDNLEYKKKLEEREKRIEELVKIDKQIADLVDKKDLKNETKIITKILKTRPLKPIQLMNQTQFPIGIIYKVISDLMENKKATYTNDGGIKLL